MGVDLLQLLDAGGNLSIVFATLLLWRVDKRVSRLEWEIFERHKQRGEHVQTP